MAGTRSRQARMDARRHGFHAVRDGHRAAARVLQHERRDSGAARNRHAGDVGRRWNSLRVHRRPRRSHARADGNRADFLARVNRGFDVAVDCAAACLARRSRHRHGRRVGLGRRAGERDLARRSTKQGHQHHAVGVGDRLHHRRRRRRCVHRHIGTRPRRLALALCLWCGARTLRVVDTTVGAGTGGLDRAASRNRRRWAIRSR